MPDAKRGEGRGICPRELDLYPAGFGEIDVLSKDPVPLGMRAVELAPLFGAHGEFRIRHFPDPADVVEVKMGDNDLDDIACGKSQGPETLDEGIFGADTQAKDAA